MPNELTFILDQKENYDIVENDIEKVNETKSCFASLLSPQGKFLFDFKICLTSIANPIEPKIIAPTEANNSSLTNAELKYIAIILKINAKTRISFLILRFYFI